MPTSRYPDYPYPEPAETDADTPGAPELESLARHHGDARRTYIHDEEPS